MKKILINISCALLLLFNQGCQKFVELDAPETLVITKELFQQDETAVSAMMSVYAGLSESQFQPYYLSMYTGTYTDELQTNSPSFAELYQNGLNPVGSTTNNMWSACYNLIYQANAIYEGCLGSNALSPAVKKQLMAEALFMRAYNYFYLVNLYGELPLVRTTNYAANATLSRQSVSSIYEQMILDLKTAYADLNENYVAPNCITVIQDRVRANKAAAAALLSRIYLYTGKYQEAEEQASYVLANKAAYDLTELNAVFLKNSKEAVLQLQKPLPSSNNAVTLEGYNYILTAAPGTANRGSSYITPSLLKVFTSTDKRGSNWIGMITDKKVIPNVDYYFPYKYKVDITSNGNFSECSTPFRVAELYLIRAEARAQQNRLADAIADIDLIRKRAGIALIAESHPTISKEDLLAALLDERQKELFTEYGHRFFDLKRTGKIDQVMNIAAEVKKSTWGSYKKVWPIPQTEIDKNQKIVQNQGYN